MHDHEWIESLAVGDEVAVSNSNGGGFTIRKVTHLTPTQIVVGASRFRRKDGGLIGGSMWYSAHISPVTPDIRDRCERGALVRAMRDMTWSSLTTEQLRAVYAIAGGAT